MERAILSRRGFLAGCGAAALFTPHLAHAAGPQLSEDGLYEQPWFLQSFLDLADDFRGAKEKGKGFILIWELRGCPYCKLLHTVNLANPKIAAYAQENFDVLQLNLVGSRPVTDFDGKELAEKDLAARYQIAGTPTLQFFAEGPSGQIEETVRTNYLKPPEFFGMLRFVRERAYETMPFEAYLKENPPQI